MTIYGKAITLSTISGVAASISLQSGNGATESVSLYGPQAATGTYYLYLPPAAGTTGQVMALADNSGTLGWAAVLTNPLGAHFSAAASNTYNLGGIGSEWKNIYITGVMYQGSNVVIDGSGNLQSQNGVSVSGTSCTVKAIVAGIVTSATCP